MVSAALQTDKGSIYAQSGWLQKLTSSTITCLYGKDGRLSLPQKTTQIKPFIQANLPRLTEIQRATVPAVLALHQRGKLQKSIFSILGSGMGDSKQALADMGAELASGKAQKTTQSKKLTMSTDQQAPVLAVYQASEAG